MIKKNNKVALVTGASSGIGKAIYMDLIAKGFKVYGTSRKIEENQVIEIDGGKMICLDITQKQSVENAVLIIEKNEGRLDVLVNNAGYGIAGSTEDTNFDEAFSQFDTNFFGVLNLINTSLNLLRKTQGIIVNVSSVAGILSIPFQGMYSASKAALEAISEVLRMELKRDKIRICLVEPGDTKTAFTENRVFVAKAPDSAYKARLEESVAKMAKDEQNGTSPDKVAHVVYSMIKRKNPPIRKAVGVSYKILVFLKRLLPSRLVLWILEKMYA